MADNPEASSAPPAPETPRFARDGEVLPPYVVNNPENLAALSASQSLPHELYAARVAIVAALKSEGYTRKQIAKSLGMTLSGVHWCVKKARERELLKAGMAETMELLENEALPLAVEGLLADLKKGNQEAYLATLRGKGLLRNYNQVKNEGGGGAANLAFQFNFVTPDGRTIESPAVPELKGQVFGVERDE